MNHTNSRIQTQNRFHAEPDAPFTMPPVERSLHGELRPAAAGSLFGGLLPCYVLPDQRRVVAEYAIVRALTSGTAAAIREEAKHRHGPVSKLDSSERVALVDYLAWLPSRYRPLTELPATRILAPLGRATMHVLVRDAGWVSDLFDAYVDAAVAGELHLSQRPLAAAAYAIQSAARKAGWRALVDEATGLQAGRTDDDLHQYFTRRMRTERRRAGQRIAPPFVPALQHEHLGAIGVVADAVGDELAFVEECFRGPHAAKAAWINLAMAELIASESATPVEWRARMRSAFFGEPLPFGIG